MPTVLFASLSWDNKYKIQMSPYKNKMVNDAGAVYPDLSAYAALRTTHWSGSHVDGYNFGTDAAQFHAALSLADVTTSTRARTISLDLDLANARARALAPSPALAFLRSRSRSPSAAGHRQELLVISLMSAECLPMHAGDH